MKIEAKPAPGEALALVENIADDACMSLFEAYGVKLHEVSAGTTTTLPILLAGVVGFSGRGICGTCILGASETPILKSNPVEGSLRDWIAELSNQLVGRIKNKLLLCGAEVYVNTPVVLRGEQLAPLPCRELPPLAFATEGGNVFVWIELETQPDFVLGPASQNAALPEGDGVMF